MADDPRGPLVVGAILLGSFLGPSDYTVKIGLTLTSLRFALLLLLFPALLRMWRKIRSGRYVPIASDILALSLTVWMEIALVATTGWSAVATPYGVYPVEFFAAYLIGRTYFADRSSLTRLVQVLVVVVGLMLLMGLADTVSGRNIFGSVARGALVDPNLSDATTQYRFGLPRARGPLEHAIIYGLFFSVCATLIYFLMDSIRQRLIGLVLCLSGTVIALSSAPILSVVIFAALAGYNWMFSTARWRWRALLFLAAYLVVIVMIAYDDPIEQLIKILTLDPQTGIYRLQIWKWVAYNLTQSPLFGIGTTEWVRLTTMSPSIDAVWLNLALRYGYVGVGLMIAVILGAFFVITPRRMRLYDDDWKATTRIGVTIALFQMVFASFTVHYWGSSWALFSLLIGIRAGLSEVRYLPAPQGSHPLPLNRRGLAAVGQRRSFGRPFGNLFGRPLVPETEA